MDHEVTHTVQQGSVRKGLDRDELDKTQEESFGSNNYKQETLGSGTVIYRLTGPSTRHMLSDYWISKQTFLDLIKEVQGAYARYLGPGTEHLKKNLIRNELALLDKWGNKLTHKQKVVLVKDVVAYTGGIGVQSYSIVPKVRKNEPFTPKTRQKLKKRIELRRTIRHQIVIPCFHKEYGLTLNNNPYTNSTVPQKLFKG